MNEIKGLMRFLDGSPTAFHAVDNICRELEAAGYRRLEEREVWQITPGDKCFLTRNGSSVIALRIPEKGFSHFQIVASHSDSPMFKLKPNAGRVCQGCAALNVEKYGGMLMSTWVDRPLSVAGRLIIAGDHGLETRLVNVDRDLAIIPNVPIHFNRDVNDHQSWNAQTDMLPIIGGEGADIMAVVAAAAGVEAAQIAGSDLFLYNRDRATLFGAEEEFIASPRLDDLECAYASLRALLQARPGEHIDVLCVFDNEEVGSGTKQGADSSMLSEALSRVADALGAAPQELCAAIAGSFMISADNAHAVHPSHPEKYDPDNRAWMNRGVVVKANANQKYTSDGVSTAVFERICARAEVPTQRFANRSDVRGGSTLGNIANSHVSLNTVDIGLAQLAMHSACETAGARDVELMIRAMRAFHEAEIDVRRDGLIDVRLGASL